ncbi:MAG: biotin/lipoyl-binding protein [Candidatus Pacebacteria bacterium]|nr:biotin/lipoyl-binding protein [Candidatus Paceibacterota bacterium]
MMSVSKITGFLKANKKKILIGGGVIILLVIIFSGNKGEEISTHTVTRDTLIEEVVVSGTIDTDQRVDLSFSDVGRIASVSVDRGDTVSSGSVLASLDTADLEAELREARANVLLQQATGDASFVDLESARKNIDRLTLEQDSLVASSLRTLLSQGLEAYPVSSSYSVPAPIISGTYGDIKEGSYEISVYASGSSSGASFVVSGLEDRMYGEALSQYPVPLGTKGLFIQFEDGYSYTNTKWTIDIPNKRSSLYTVNKGAYDQALATRDRVIAQAEDTYESLRIQESDTTDQSITRARIEQAKARVDGILARIAKRKIIAPFKGIIQEVNLKVGESVMTAFQSAIILSSPGGYGVELSIPELFISKLSAGLPVTVEVDALVGEVFSGTLSTVSSSETDRDGVSVYQGYVTFDKDVDVSVFRAGMTATVRILVQEFKDIIVVPNEYIERDTSGISRVQIMKDEETIEKEITVGIRNSAGLVHVIEGVNENDVLVAW